MNTTDAALPVSDLLASLRSGNSSSPRLTWYGPDGERVELSGRVLDNWVAKTSNLLQDELDAEPGMQLLLDMPAHWKSVVWLLAGWQLGLEILLDAGASGPAGIVVTADPAAAPKGAPVIAVALPALAMKWPGELPGGVLDFAAEVRSHGDVFMAHAQADPGAPAISAGGRTYLHADLLSGFAAPQKHGTRLLVHAREGLEQAAAKVLGALASDGSVVLVHPDVGITGHLLAAERVSEPHSG